MAIVISRSIHMILGVLMIIMTVLVKFILLLVVWGHPLGR